MRNLAVLVLGLLSFIGVNAQSVIDASEIIEKINNGQDVIYENVIIEGDLDFTQVDNLLYADLNLDRYVISDLDDMYDRTSDNYYVEIDSKIEFINCEFEGVVTGYRVDEEENRIYNAKFNNTVSFGGCTFTADVNFKYSLFEEETEMEYSILEAVSNFKYAQFNSIINFSGTDFYSYSNFSSARFNGLAVFQKTNFNKKALFGQANFAKAVYFTGTTFTERALFTYAKFKEAVFSNARFDSDGVFSYATFKESAKFTNAKFNDKAEFQNAKLNDIDLEGTTFNMLPDFKNTLVNKSNLFSYILKN